MNIFGNHGSLYAPEPLDGAERRRIDELVRTAFAGRGEAGAVETDIAVSSVADANHGGGVFSRVFRLELTVTPGSRPLSIPGSAVAKLPARGANRMAAIRSGAYAREAHCYRYLLIDAGLPVAEVYAVVEHGDGTASFLLQDLTALRWPDQMTGLTPEDAAAVVVALAGFHRRWRHDLDRPEQRHPQLAKVRANTVAGLDHRALATGIRVVEERWARHLSNRQLATLDMVLRHYDDVAAAYGSHRSVTLCHGDPRAANIAFEPGGSAVLVDWQQAARQFGEADLAWLCATSLTAEDRRRCEHDLIREYGGDIDRYRLGLALPAMAVLLLAQRAVDSSRTAVLIATSLERISTAVMDHW